jgi:hypothetical protein
VKPIAEIQHILSLTEVSAKEKRESSKLRFVCKIYSSKIKSWVECKKLNVDLMFKMEISHKINSKTSFVNLYPFMSSAWVIGSSKLIKKKKKPNSTGAS